MVIALIDSKGHHIYPGFIDLYSNYGVASAERQRGSNSYGDGPVYVKMNAKAAMPATPPSMPSSNGCILLKPDADEAARKPDRAQGFTVVQSARMDGIFRGQAVVASLGEWLAR